MSEDKNGEALDAIKKAEAVIVGLNNGSRRWTMSIPAQPDYDPDIVISDALHKATMALRSASSSCAATEAKFLRELRDLLCPPDGVSRAMTFQQLSALNALNDRLEVLSATIARSAVPESEATIKGVHKFDGETRVVAQPAAPSTPQPIDEAFYKLTVQQRDAARREVESLKCQLADEIRMHAEAMSAWKADIERLSASRSASAEPVAWMIDDPSKAYDRSKAVTRSKDVAKLWAKAFRVVGLAPLSSSAAHDPWKEAVIDGLICAHIYSKADEEDPRKALNKLLAWEQSVALDPRVSSAAEALVEQGRQSVLSSSAAWIPVGERLPTMEIDRGNWLESKRVVVFVQRGPERYEAFGWLTSRSVGYDWRIQGHNGDWHENVTHWTPLPDAPRSATAPSGSDNSPRSDKT